MITKGVQFFNCNSNPKKIQIDRMDTLDMNLKIIPYICLTSVLPIYHLHPHRHTTLQHTFSICVRDIQGESLLSFEETDLQA